MSLESRRSGGGGRTASAVLLLAAVVAVSPGNAAPVSGQEGLRMRGGVVVEDYTFDPGLGFESIREITAPVVVEVPVAGRTRLTVAGGWVDVRMVLADGSVREVSGALDPEARLEVDLVRDRLRLLVTGAVPSGTGSVAEADLVLLGALTNDLLAFSSPALGSGGAVGVGLAGAVPAGRASLGWALHARAPLSYEPVLGTGDEVRAGNEIRLRAGVESPVGRRAFVRVAAVASFRDRDELNGRSVNGVGNRVAGYAAFEAPLGGTVASAWVSGLYRADPSLEPTAVGAAFVPRGSFLSAGARLTLGLGAVTRFEPEVEFRTASSAFDAAGLELDPLGDVVRVGARLRRPVADGLGVVAEGSGLFGSVQGDQGSVDTRGYRASVFLEWSR